MRSAYPERVYYKWLVLAAAALALWGVGSHSDTLTTAGLTAGGSIAHAQETADAPARITGITVSRQEQDTQVTISGSRPLTYTVVKLQSPLKILVDIPDCTMEKTMGPGGIDSDLVSEVTSQALQKGESTYLRVEIALKKDVTYTVNAELSDLVIRMTGIGAPATTAEQEEPEASPEPAAAAPPAVREGQIVDLEIRTDDVGLTVVADDMINTYNTLQLDDPVRLVIDIPGVKDQLEKKVYSLQSSILDKVKVGQHPGKVRFAIYFKFHFHCQRSRFRKSQNPDLAAGSPLGFSRHFEPDFCGFYFQNQKSKTFRYFYRLSFNFFMASYHYSRNYLC